MHIRVEDGVVKECVEQLPTDPQGDWREVIDVPPILISGRQITGNHSFDLTKTPAEIIWGIIDISVEDRKQSVYQNYSIISQKIVNGEMFKEFQNIPINHDQSVIDAELLKWRALRVEILALETHEEIEALEANN
jgi:hypothetical protein